MKKLIVLALLAFSSLAVAGDYPLPWEDPPAFVSSSR
jgi:hypothetical protein